MAGRDDVKPENQIVNGEKIKQALVEDEGSMGKKSFSDKGDSKEGFNFTFQKYDFSGKRVSETPDLKGKTPEFRQNLQEIIDKARITVRDSRNGNFSVKLYPRELGNVNVNLSLDHGTITARFVVDSEEAKNLLSQNMDNLRQQLKDAGIEVGEFFVNVNDHGKRFFQENNQDRKKDLLLFPEGKEAGMAAIEYDGNTHVLNSSSINVVI
jgi:flagellar hook-length control protein FliK